MMFDPHALEQLRRRMDAIEQRQDELEHATPAALEFALGQDAGLLEKIKSIKQEVMTSNEIQRQTLTLTKLLSSMIVKDLDLDDGVLEMLRAAFVKRGLLFPETDKEVAEAEKRMEEDPVELPESLKEPPTHLLDQMAEEAARPFQPAGVVTYADQTVTRVVCGEEHQLKVCYIVIGYDQAGGVIITPSSSSSNEELHIAKEHWDRIKVIGQEIAPDVDPSALADLAIEGAKAAERKIRQRVAQELFEVFRQTGPDTAHGRLEVLRHAVGQLQQGKKATGAI